MIRRPPRSTLDNLRRQRQMCIRDSIYTMEHYTAERKKELLPFATAWMEVENIILSEINNC